MDNTQITDTAVPAVNGGAHPTGPGARIGAFPDW
jgi:hypothetical protein